MNVTPIWCALRHTVRQDNCNRSDGTTSTNVSGSSARLERSSAAPVVDRLRIKQLTESRRNLIAPTFSTLQRVVLRFSVIAFRLHENPKESIKLQKHCTTAAMQA
jgi:hypothetical protein